MTFQADLKAALVAAGADTGSPLTDAFANGFAAAILLWAGGGGGGGLTAPVHLTSQVDQVLPVANGGTGSATAPAGGFAGLTALGAEAVTRAADDVTLAAAIVTEAGTRSAADATEASTRSAADATNASAISAETSARIAGDAATLASAAADATTKATNAKLAAEAFAVYEIPLSAGLQTVTSTALTRVGERTIDMSQHPAITGYTRHVRLLADVNKTSGATNGVLRLYDLTHSVAVTSSSSTTTSNAGEEKDSGDLTVGSASGNLRDDVASRYQLQMQRTGGVDGTDAVFVTNARLLIYYV